MNFFNTVKFREILIKIGAKTLEIDSKFSKKMNFDGKIAKIKPKN